MKKTVYIIGAGFSKGVNAPLQSEIIRDVFDLEINILDNQLGVLYNNYRNDFQDFIENVLYIDRSKFKDIALEDIYTPIDRCISDNVSFRNIEKSELIELRQKINALIIILIKHKLENTDLNNYVSKFAQYLVKIKKTKNKQSDPFSIISLNWDIILDNALHRYIKKDEGVIDYCCFVTPFNKNDNILPGLLARGKGLYNLKILKPHGSMNWLQCQRCQRLYVTFYEKIAVEEFLTKPKCRICQRNYSNSETNDGGTFLLSQLVMPTFLKDLNNVQIKLIWQNAGVELSEANRIIFMGYSFPAADFEMRQLLSRTVRHDAKIDIVLLNQKEQSDRNSPEYRYLSFFGKRDIKFRYDGVEKYIDVILK